MNYQDLEKLTASRIKDGCLTVWYVESYKEINIVIHGIVPLFVLKFNSNMILIYTFNIVEDYIGISWLVLFESASPAPIKQSNLTSSFSSDKGYPYNLDFDYVALALLQHFSINNLCDPSIKRNYGVHSMMFEVGVLDWLSCL